MADDTERSGVKGSNAVESGGNQARCSVKAINDIISGFDERKRKLVESIGFGGLLKFPPIKSTNRKFSSWLMGQVDVANSCLALPNGSILSFTKKDIATVFGIPDTGKRVNEAGHLSKEAKERLKLQCWPIVGKDQRSIKAVQQLVDTRYPLGMNAEQETAFKVAFVVFVMSTLFVPGAKHDYVHVDYWGTLSDASCIHKFDWADYIHKKLLTAAAKFKSDKESGCRAPHITGCYLFLQVLYLDNLEIGEWDTQHSVLPRISSFTYELIKGMIAADTVHRKDGKSTPEFGKSKVRSREQSCYTWAHKLAMAPHTVDKESQISLWYASVRMARVLRLPLEAAGPIFVAVDEIDRRRLDRSSNNGMECINVLLSIMEPFVDGFRYHFEWQSSNNGGGCIPSRLMDTDGLDPDCPELPGSRHDMERHNITSACENHFLETGTSSSAERQTQSSDEMLCTEVQVARKRICTETSRTGACIEDDHCQVTNGSNSEGVDYLVIRSMARFYLLVRRIKEHNRIDLNATTTNEANWLPVQRQVDVRNQEGVRSPWELGCFWPFTERTPSALCQVSEQHDNASHRRILTPPRIVHYWPKYIEVMPNAAREQEMGVSEMEMDMMDAIMRRFMQSDDQLYTSEGRLRWRHFFESDILAAVVAGCFDIENPCLRNQFVGSHLKYDVYNCRMLYFPVILHQRWVCFAWDLKYNNIRVFDPACSNISMLHRRSVYTHVADMLKQTLIFFNHDAIYWVES